MAKGDSPSPEDFTGKAEGDNEELLTTRRKMMAGVAGGSAAGGYGLYRLYNSLTDVEQICPSYEIRDDVAHENNLITGREYGDHDVDEDSYHKVVYNDEEETWYLERSFLDPGLEYVTEHTEVDDSTVERILERADESEYEWGEEILEVC